ncbi:MAG TPA: ATP-dependent protease ATPase subunit HslU [Chloroflexota bacterium]|nr:ATP-dependent protease ATPase subunit HslU [Chloroflexota bacterium]
MSDVNLEALTPESIVRELDRYIVGQTKAKRAVAVALRNRYRRQRVPAELRDEITPKNILMIGPTGVGKTEVARRLARLADAPFIKVEATKFTEVGYVGRDVESIVRDLVENAVTMVHDERMEGVRERAEDLANERLISVLMKTLNPESAETPSDDTAAVARSSKARTEQTRRRRSRRAVAKMLADHKLEEQIVEIEVESDEGFSSAMEFVSGMSVDEINEAFQDFIANLQASRKRSRQVSVREARRILIQEESNKLVDWDSVVDSAIEKVEQSGIVFIDEIDKIVSRGNNDSGPDVSGEGVQRDLLPIVEGSTVNTRYGPVKTDHILFIGAGAFHRAKPSDLIPELQGRFPLRVELDRLTEQDFITILTKPDNALTKQYQLLLQVEDVELTFPEDGLSEIARVATALNERSENIGARRLHTVMERVLEDISFEASAHKGETITVDRDYVRSRVAEIAANDDLSKFIL